MTTEVSEQGYQYRRRQSCELRQKVEQIVRETPLTDLHTHLFAPVFGPLLLYGIDELLTYHYLVAEVIRATNISPDAFWAKSKDAQSNLIWEELFVKRSPISESCRGVLTVLDRLGLDVASRDLAAYRGYFREQEPDAHIDRVFVTANIRDAVMTNDPFDETERPIWLAGRVDDPRFHAALRIDTLLLHWPECHQRLHAWGYDVEMELGTQTLREIRRFLSDWLKRMGALYMAVSLPPDFAFPETTMRARILTEAVLPVAEEHGVPFAMMIGVKRAVNQPLRLAGDGLGIADVGGVEAICAAYPRNKFMVTMLARENQHALCVAARKFPNLFLFGCWWFLNNPSLIEEMTRMRIELLGISVAPQHSDARVLEQVIYKWDHSRRIIGRVLGDKYCDLIDSGWAVSDAEIRSDVARLLHGNFWEFVKR